MTEMNAPSKSKINNLQIKKIKILNCAFINPDAILEWNEQTQEILASMCMIGVIPQIQIIQCEL
jgi:hypothetical protein